MDDVKEKLNEFVEWAKYCGEDVWYIFDHTEEAIGRFLSKPD